MTRTGLFLRRQLWIWPIVATVVLSLLAYGVHRAIESTMRENLRSQLVAFLDVDAAMLENWVKTQTEIVQSLANDLENRETIYSILTEWENEAAPSPTSEKQKLLKKQLGPAMSSHGYVGFFVADKNNKIIATSHAETFGREIPQYDAIIARSLDGEPSICAPFPSTVTMKDEFGKVRTGVPTMFACAPVRDAGFEVVGVLGMRIRPELEFTRILQLGRFGDTGETYAVNKAGLMVSNSRFDESLILLGILPDQPDSRSIVNVQVRDPQGDLTAGYRMKVRRSELPLTRPAMSLAEGSSGVDLNGYRDYRGVPSIGAWKWLPKYDLGIISEVDKSEAFGPLTILTRTFWVLHGLLALASIAIFAFTIVVARLQREAQKVEIEAKKLGQYTLERKIAAGGMGVVYKGHHSMLRRETAIKMLDVDRVNDASLARFEREVQITCQLNNPNTVAIYDYGRTPEGVFYYAMEFLDGIDLEKLVRQYGPQSEGRVIHILKQICGSLFEAHSLGLVHRDIKPANIMLNRRGGEPDVVKVLDFGLVKALDDEKQASTTAANSLTGTPLYMAPESIQAPNTVDARSDLYAVGAVGYFLLTGHPVFDSSNLIELCQQHVEKIPMSPSQRAGRTISSELEHAILTCLEKSRSKRPSTARDLSKLLDRCPTISDWSVDDADAWWGRHEHGLGAAKEQSNEPPTSSQALDRTIITDHPE